MKRYYPNKQKVEPTPKEVRYGLAQPDGEGGWAFKAGPYRNIKSLLDDVGEEGDHILKLDGTTDVPLYKWTDDEQCWESIEETK